MRWGPAVCALSMRSLVAGEGGTGEGGRLPLLSGWEGVTLWYKVILALGREFSSWLPDGWVRVASRAPGPGSREAMPCSGSGAAAVQEALGRVQAGWADPGRGPLDFVARVLECSSFQKRSSSRGQC